MCRTLLIGCVLVAIPGCRSVGDRLLSLGGPAGDVLVIAAVIEPPPKPAEPFGQYPRYEAFERAYEAETGRPASVETCYLFQARLGLESGRYHAALLSPVQFAQLSDRDTLQVLAVSRDSDGRACQAAVLVVPAAGDIREVAALRGRSIAFGPQNDSLTHHAALHLLEQSGLAKGDLALELLPVPGSLKHLPDGRAVAQAVLAGNAAAGFMTEGEWEALAPDRGIDATESAAAGPVQSELRVLARTVALPRQLVVVPKRLSAARSRELLDFLLGVGPRHAGAVAAQGCGGYVAATDEVLAGCRALRVREPAEPPPSPAEE